MGGGGRRARLSPTSHVILPQKAKAGLPGTPVIAGIGSKTTDQRDDTDREKIG
jgi:hypothetical protein